MAFFGLSDITFTNEQQRTGPLAKLYENRNVAKAFRYPLDIGNYDKGHYMVIHVNTQVNSKIQGIQQMMPGASSLSSSMKVDPKNATKNIKEKFSGAINGAIDSGVAAINRKTNGALSWLQPSGPSFDSRKAAQATNSAQYISSVKDIQNTSLLKTTKQSDESIVLYMPDTLSFSSSQNYEQLELGRELAGQVGKVAASVIESLQSGTGDAGQKLAGALKGGLTAGAIKAIGNATGSQQTGAAFAFLANKAIINPQLELLYSSPNFREFQFEFTFYPRDEREALEVQNIIERLRFHQAPELLTDTAGLLMVPPSEFEIEFYYGGQKNPNIPAITTCVLTSIDVNYAPDGWSAYEMPGENKPQLGRTGMPTAIQLALMFKETSFLTKSSFRTADDQLKASKASGSR